MTPVGATAGVMVIGAAIDAESAPVPTNALVDDVGLVMPPTTRVPAVLAGSAQVPVSVMVMIWPLRLPVPAAQVPVNPLPKVTVGDAGEVDPAGKVTRTVLFGAVALSAARGAGRDLHAPRGDRACCGRRGGHARGSG